MFQFSKNISASSGFIQGLHFFQKRKEKTARSENSDTTVFALFATLVVFNQLRKILPKI